MKKQKCECSSGYYCPAGSTEKDGKPIETLELCEKDSKCYCKEGHYCREKSTYASLSNQKCEAEFVCPKGSTTSRGKPVITSTDLFAKCEEGKDCTIETIQIVNNILFFHLILDFFT